MDAPIPAPPSPNPVSVTLSQSLSQSQSLTSLSTLAELPPSKFQLGNLRVAPVPPSSASIARCCTEQPSRSPRTIGRLAPVRVPQTSSRGSPLLPSTSPFLHSTSSTFQLPSVASHFLCNSSSTPSFAYSKLPPPTNSTRIRLPSTLYNFSLLNPFAHVTSSNNVIDMSFAT